MWCVILTVTLWERQRKVVRHQGGVIRQGTENRRAETLESNSRHKP